MLLAFVKYCISKTAVRPAYWLLLGSCFLSITSCDSSKNTEPQPPNILFIAIDDLRPELGSYGVTEVSSPHIDRLSRQGTIFTSAYCQMSWCSPSRTSLMTGLYPHNTGVLDLQTHFRSTIPHIKTLPQHFKENGYAALSFGKVYHNSEALQDSLSWSKPAWLPDHPNPIQAYALDTNKNIAQANPYHKATATEKAAVPDTAYPDGQTTRLALEAMQDLAKDEQPFFLAVGYYKPHLPFAAPERYWQNYQASELPLAKINQLPQGAPPYLFRSWSEPGSYLDVPKEEPFVDSLSAQLKMGYYACVSFIDEQLGQLLGQLETLGLQDNTIIVLWGDHGFKLGEYGRWSKHSTMEIDTRVPLILSVPGLAGGQEVNSIVELVDIYPTLCELAGLSLPSQKTDGQSFARLMASTDSDSAEHAYAYSTIVHDSMQAHSLRNQNFRFTAWLPVDEQGEIRATELYDHRTDPNETTNLATSANYQKEVKQFVQILREELGLNMSLNQ